MGERGRDHQQRTLNWDPEGLEAVAGLRKTTRAWRRTSALPLGPAPPALPLPPRHEHFPRVSGNNPRLSEQSELGPGVQTWLRSPRDT